MADMTDSTNVPAWRALPLIAIGIASVVGVLTLRDYVGFEALSANRDALIAFRDDHYLATVLSFSVLYIGIVAFGLPGAAVGTLTGGFLFGVFPGVVFTLIAATTGALIIFLAARWGLGERLAARMDATEGTVRRVKAGIDANQWEVLFLMRLVPVVPFFVANLLLALLAVPVWRFVVSTFFGIIPGALVYTSVGSGLGEVFASGEQPDLGVIFEPHILLPILGLCALTALPMILRALRSGDREE